MGHNSELTDDERKVLFMSHYRNIAAQEAKVTEQKKALSKPRKLAKADGIVLRDMDFALRCAEVDDDTIIPDELKRQLDIAEWFGLPIGSQRDLFQIQETAEQAATKAGEVAGLKGEDGTSPHANGSQEDQWWLNGWERGQKTMRENLETAMKKNQDNEPDASIPDAA